MAAEELALALTGEEAEVLALGAACDRQPPARRDLAHLRLGQLPEREANARQ